jgi:hypothetical protein
MSVANKNLGTLPEALLLVRPAVNQGYMPLGLNFHANAPRTVWPIKETR